MVRRRKKKGFARRRSGGVGQGLFMKLIKGGIAGLAVGAVARRAPVLSTIGYADTAAAGAGGYFVGKVPGAIAGALANWFGKNKVEEVIGGNTGTGNSQY